MHKYSIGVDFGTLPEGRFLLIQLREKRSLWQYMNMLTE